MSRCRCQVSFTIMLHQDDAILDGAMGVALKKEMRLLRSPTAESHSVEPHSHRNMEDISR